MERWNPRPEGALNLDNTKKTLQRKKGAYGWQKQGGGRYSRWWKHNPAAEKRVTRSGP